MIYRFPTVFGCRAMTRMRKPLAEPVPHQMRCKDATRRPSLAELGDDLLEVSRFRLCTTLAIPFLFMASYAFFAYQQWWTLAVVSVMGLSFVTYGSTSHDLVHRTLGLSRGLNDLCLSLIELLSLRSGTAYRLSHLHHHAHLLGADDIEGAAAFRGFWNAIFVGPAMQIRIWTWAWEHHPRKRRELALEAIGIASLISVSLVATAWSPAPIVYVTLVAAGSWLFPLVTVYFPHDGDAIDPLKKTRLFRGWFFHTIAFGHLYHLEHHLYPAVPHHHWKSLADRLDPYFDHEGIEPYQFGTKM